MAYATSLIAIAVLLLFGYIFVVANKRAQPPNGSRYPPGPPGKPLVGNLLEIPPKHSWLQFKTWADRYGPLMRLNIAGKEHYVVSTEQIANDLLRERGSLYSSREQLPAAVLLLSDNLRPLFLPYNDVWRKGRKFMHQVANANVAADYQPTQLLESTRMLRDLIQEPEKYEQWFERYSAGVIFRLAFGKRVDTGEEEVVKDILSVVHTVERVASPGAYLVDVLPSMMLLPKVIAPFKRELEGLHQKEHKLFVGLLEDVRNEMRQGVAPPCWERDFLENQKDLDLTDDEGAYVVGTLFEAGAGTTAAAMMSWMLAMTLHPAWYEKLQAEVDAVCGDSRMPVLDDVPQLPTVRAVVKEVLRWRPVTAGGVPHQLVKDDVYNGIFLPAGTNVHANQWAIKRDPELYPDPETFNPDRWLNPSFPTFREPLTTYPNLHNFSAFGFGRRICPGQNIAERSLNLLSSRIAWACNLTKAKDENGNDISPPLYDYTAGFNVQPKWFPFTLSVRSEQRMAIVQNSYEEEARTDPLKNR